MSKVLKNNTSPAVDVAIKDTGITIISASSYTIEPNEYVLWAGSEDILAKVTSGDIVVNDGVDDLSVAAGISYLRLSEMALAQRFAGDTLRSNGFPDTLSTQEAVEFAKTTVSGKMQDFEFTTIGNSFDKWVNVGHPSDSSDNTPFIALWDGSVIGLSFVNKNDDASTDLEVYVNGVLGYTWSIRNKRWAYNTNEAGFFSVVQGDKISIFAKKVTGTVTHPSGISGEVMAVISAVGTNSGGSDVL